MLLVEWYSGGWCDVVIHGVVVLLGVLVMDGVWLAILRVGVCRNLF